MKAKKIILALFLPMLLAGQPPTLRDLGVAIGILRDRNFLFRPAAVKNPVSF
jgi:hypothetical protein